MRRKITIAVCIVSLLCQKATGQEDAVKAYEQLTQLTKLFRGNTPYSCLAIVSVQYKLVQQKNTSDTSRLIYKNKSTYYKSPSVERLEGPQGELIINHQLKTATLDISDSVREVLYKELKIEADKSFEAKLDADYDRKDEDAFKTYVQKYCKVTRRNAGDGSEEISFAPKSDKVPAYISMKIRYNGEGKVLYYEYITDESYATDWNGKPRVRRVTTIYDRFRYDNVPDIPVQLSEYLDWEGWNVKLKKYTNYKFSLL